MKESEPAPALIDRAAGFDPAARGRSLVLAAVGLYVLMLVVAFATGHYAFIPKEALIPAFLLIPALAGQLRAFVAEWAIFLALIVFFDSLRGLAFALITAFELPVYMGYAITADRALLGDTLPNLLQTAWLPDRLGAFEYALIVVHASHFLVFLLFGMVVWFWRRPEFRLFSAAFVTLIYTGLIGYLAVPTVPPWMAASAFETIAPIRHVTAEVYNTALPAFFRGFDTNPIAAMPSMHTAIPVLIALLGLRWFGRHALPLVIYAAAVITSITYLGEHYLVDVLAGVGLAVAVDQFIHRIAAARLLAHQPLPPRTRGLIALLLLVAMFGVGKLNLAIGGGWIPSRAFVADELQGQSPMGLYYRGYYALEDGEPAVARAALAALPERLVDGHVVRMLAQADAALGEPQRGFDRLRDWGTAHPEDPEPLFWATKIAYQGSLIGRPQVEMVAAQLRDRYGEHRLGPDLAAELEALLEGVP